MVRCCGRALAFLTTLLLFVFVMRSARADDPTARAKAHFENAIHLYDQKPPDYEGALAEFRAAEKDRPSPGIKKNVALCLRALHRYGEAVDELELMLATTEPLKPETREAGKKMLAELNALIATIKLRIVLHKAAGASTTDVPHVDVTVDGAAIASDKLGAPVRVGPGDHVFVARATGYGDTTKKVSVVSGDRDVPAQLDLMPAASGTALGSLRIHVSDPKAVILIDGVALANGVWEGALPAGKHHVEARVEGQPTWSRDVEIPSGTHVEVEAVIGDSSANAPPSPYVPEKSKSQAKPDRPWYLQAGLAFVTGTQTVNRNAFTNAENFSNRGLDGASLVAKAGRKLGKVVAVELWGELGVMKPLNYDKADVTLGYFQLGPEIRLHSNGKFRVVGGTGLGLEIDVMTVNGRNGNVSNKGGGVEGAWLLEGGAQLAIADRFYVESSLFLDVSGNGTIKIQNTDTRYFLDSPWARGGLRVQFGFDL